jgi:pimeloyl-ACP methyl ester carboxylesterase
MPIAKLSTGVSVYYEVLGSGEPVLLIMGTGGDHTFWESTLPAYRDGFQAIIYDNRGTGKSDCPPDPTTYSMRVLADDAAALLDELGIETAHVSGLSLGSTVAQELAINHPQRVRSLQLHCTWGRTDEWLRRLFTGMAYPVQRGDFEHFVLISFMWVMSPAYLSERPNEVAAIERAYLLENPHPPTREGLLGHLHADLTHDALDRLESIRARTLITSGEMDWQIPPRYGKAVHERIPDSRFHLFTGPYSSHMTFFEMADEFNELSRAFLDE